MTNRISRYLPTDAAAAAEQGHPLLKAERRLVRDVDSMLRDMAFVLKMTQRVKSEILEENVNA